MRILAFEYLSGGGVAGHDPIEPGLDTFLRQGLSMLEAVCRDFLALGHEVTVPLCTGVESDLRESCRVISVEHQSELKRALLSAAQAADRILIIAPESDRLLVSIVEMMQPWSARLISPNLEFVRLTSNKWNTFQWFSQHGVPCPRTYQPSFEDQIIATCETYPLVVKPVNGAGSENVRLVDSPADLPSPDSNMIVQQYVGGTPVSMSVIGRRCGSHHFCPPGRQCFESKPFGIQTKTEFPIPNDLSHRALELAKQAVDALPPTTGYFGIDMILGDSSDRDFVIEVNPRLTTSYRDLRPHSDTNMAALMLEA